MKKAISPNLWRVPTDNDKGASNFFAFLGTESKWKKAMNKRKLLWFSYEKRGENCVFIRTEYKIKRGKEPFKINYTINGLGEILIYCSFFPKKELERFGVCFALPKSFGNYKWYGRGPHENYWDRKTGAAVGIYTSEVEKFIHEYVRPQENANRCDVRWFEFTDENGAGLKIEAIPKMVLSAWPYSAEDLDQANHIHELPRRDFITVNVDFKQKGVGGNNSWGAKPEPEYRLYGKKKYELKFILKPII